MSTEFYKQIKEEIRPRLKKELGCANIFQVPRLKKVVVNSGYGRNVKDKGYIGKVDRTLSLICGQKPMHNKATKSISNFKIREGMPIGASVTLRGKSMYDFVYKLINVTLPRVRDFRGLNPNSFDKNGNCSIGFRENLAFPEITGDAADLVHGLEITVCTSAKDKEEGYLLLKALGFPFKERKGKKEN